MRNFDELIDRLGALRQQSLHHARRLRLVVPLLLERPLGKQLLEDLIGSPRVRPLLKRGVYLGLAAIDQPNLATVHLVRSCLNVEALRENVLSAVVRGHCAFMEALSENGWLDQARSAGSAAQRDRLLLLLHSVSSRWGDGVARQLAPRQAQLGADAARFFRKPLI